MDGLVSSVVAGVSSAVVGRLWLQVQQLYETCMKHGCCGCCGCYWLLPTVSHSFVAEPGIRRLGVFCIRLLFSTVYSQGGNNCTGRSTVHSFVDCSL